MESLEGILPFRIDSSDDLERKSKKVERYNQDNCCKTSHCARNEYPLEKGKQTLFVNASICGDEVNPRKKPWLVEVELSKAQ